MRHLMPPVGVVLVDAWSGDWANLLADWEIDDVHFIEADDRQYQGLQLGIKNHSTWRSHAALVGREAEEVIFYQNSNPAESSILSTESLAALWPNLQTRSHLPRQIITLGSLLDDIKPPAPPNWLVVDCLYAMPVLQGAGEWLGSCDVIVARVVLDDSMLPGIDVGKSKLDTYLSTQGFRCVAIQEERHPAIGNALYVRDWNLQISRLRLAKAEQEAVAAEGQQRVKEITNERDAQASLAVETGRLLKQEGHARAEQESIATERQQQAQLQIQQLTQDRDAQAGIAVETGRQLKQEGHARAEQESITTERQQQARLEAQQLTQDRDAQASRAVETGRQLKQERRARAEQESIATQRYQQVQLRIQQLTLDLDAQASLAVETGRQMEQEKQTGREREAMVAERQQQMELQVQQLTQERDAQASLAVETARLLMQEGHARAEQESIATGRQQQAQMQVQQLMQERDAQASLAVETSRQLEQEGQTRSEHEAMVAERQQQMQMHVEQLTQERDAQASLAVETTKQLVQEGEVRAEQESIAKERQQLAHHHVEQLTQERDKQINLAAESAKQLKQEIHARAEYGASAARSQSRFNEGIAELRDTLTTQNDQLVVQLKQQADELIRVRKTLDSSIKKEILNSTKQIEAFLGVQNYFNTGELSGNMHGWPISPDLALYIIELLETNHYDLVIEFGSGVSTVLMAKTLAKIASRSDGKVKAKQIAFEHLERYYEETSENLKQAGLNNAVELIFSPLQPYVAPNGTAYSYYNCNDYLAILSKHHALTGMRILVLVDGPPKSTGAHARYPALPAVTAHFPNAHVDFLLDDYLRTDEKEIAQLWLTDIRSSNRRAALTEKKLEKDCCLLSLYY